MPLDEIKLLFCVHSGRSIIQGKRHSHNGKQTIMMQDKRENEKSTLIATMFRSRAHSIFYNIFPFFRFFFSIAFSAIVLVFTRISLVRKKRVPRIHSWKWRLKVSQKWRTVRKDNKKNTHNSRMTIVSQKCLHCIQFTMMPIIVTLRCSTVKYEN